MRWNHLILLTTILFVMAMAAEARPKGSTSRNRRMTLGRCLPLPVIDSNGSVHVTSSSMSGNIFMVTAQYKCDPGFCLQGSRTSTCRYTEGVWSSEVPKCVPEVCGRQFNNAKIGLRKYATNNRSKRLKTITKRKSKKSQERRNQKKSPKTVSSPVANACMCPAGASYVTDYNS